MPLVFKFVSATSDIVALLAFFLCETVFEGQQLGGVVSLTGGLLFLQTLNAFLDRFDRFSTFFDHTVERILDFDHEIVFCNVNDLHRLVVCLFDFFQGDVIYLSSPDLGVFVYTGQGVDRIQNKANVLVGVFGTILDGSGTDC